MNASKPSLLSEASRRHVVRVGITYLIVGSAVGGGVDVFLPNLGAPDWLVSTVLALIVLGFPLALGLSWAFDRTPEGIVRTPLVVGKSPTAHGRADASKGVDPRSLAILPLVNLSGDPENEYFSDGVTDEITRILAGIPDLKVISRTSVMQYKGTTKTVREIASELGVAVLLEGSVQRTVGRVRVVAQLIDASTDEHLWAEKYDRGLDDVFAVQSDIAESIAAALQAELSTEVRDRIRRAGTRIVDAYELVLKGKSLWEDMTAGNVARAEACFHRAIELDPNYAAAHAELGYTHIPAVYFGGADARELLPKVEAAAKEAIRLDPGLANAYVIAGWAHLGRQEWSATRHDVELAKALSPNATDVVLLASAYLMTQARCDEALAELERGLRFDPFSEFLQTHVGLYLTYSGRWAEGAAKLAEVLRDNPGAVPARLVRGIALLGLGRVDEALAELDRVSRESGRLPYFDGWRAGALHRAGRVDEAQAVVHDLERRSESEFVEPFAFYVYSITAGHAAEALQRLETCLQMGSSYISWVRNPMFHGPLADHPKFADFLGRVWPDAADPGLASAKMR